MGMGANEPAGAPAGSTPSGEAPAGGADGKQPAEGKQPPEPQKPQAAPQGAAGASGAPGAPVGKQVDGKEQPEGKKEPRVLKDDEDPGDEDDRIVVSKDSLRKRVDRGYRARLKEKFNLDEKEIGESLAALAKYREDEDKRRKESLTREQQLEEDLRAEKQARARIEKELQEKEEARLVAEQETEIKKVAEKHVDLKYWRVASADFAKHLVEEHGDKLADATITDAEVEKYFAAWAKENPGMAAGASARGAEEKPPEVKKEPLRSGAGNSGKKPTPMPTGKFAGKTLAPGRPNSMTPEEVREFKKANNMKW